MRRTPAVIRVADCWHLRAPERHLLVLALTAIALGYLMLLGARPKEGLTVAMPDLAPVLLWATAFIGAHLWLVLARFRGDQLILPVAAFLCGIGLLAQFRMGIFDGLRSGPLGLAILPTAVALMVLLAHSGQRGRYHRLAVGQWLWALLSLALLAILFATGQRFRGAVYGTGFLTPTEALKLSLILFAAAFVARHAKALAAWYGPLPPLRVLWPLLVIWLSVTALLLLKRDLGLVLILTLALLGILVAGSRHPGYLLYGLLGAGAGGYGLLTLFTHGQRRVAAWLDPFHDPTGAGWQVLQGLSGMYAGGLWGEGFSDVRPQYTPIAESDFIYAVIAEELGFAGSALVVLFLLLLLMRLIGIAGRTKQPFGHLLATGIAGVLSVQTLLNLGGVTKALPLTGLTLPLISHGGSSLLTVCASLGLILAISDDQPTQPAKVSTKRARRTTAANARPRPKPKSKPKPRAKTKNKTKARAAQPGNGRHPALARR